MEVSDVSSRKETISLLLFNASSAMSLAASNRGGLDLQILYSTPGIINVSSEENYVLLDRSDSHRWSSDDPLDFN